MIGLGLGETLKPLWQWEFPDVGTVPDVSIIIPIHGKLTMTLECLWSIHQAQVANRARAEVIVVDDASPDHSREYLQSIRGLRLVVLTENVGYLRATNEGIRQARGRHIHLLNNDTLVHGAWLDALLSTMERRGALAVGSKLVYEDGSVQEAGGIIFSDGSGWNYGRGGSADLPAVSYERRVDYCSAASLLVDGDFLRGRGGFDERYVPAYYEDTDLCFAAREAGGEVWYQPQSIVVHLEGQSHGTDESSGIKGYQVINRERFVERHAAALAQQQPPGAAKVGVARERVRGRILVVENEVPTPDRDSGSLRLFSLMQGMVDDGWGVTFLPVNGWRRQPYCQRLEAIGVEVMGTRDTWWEHLAAIGPSVRYVWLSRPEVTGEFVEDFREALPDARIVYDTVDLHFVRMQRGAELTRDPVAAAEARRMRQYEVDLMRKVDTVVVVSPVEQSILREQVQVESVLVPNVHEIQSAWGSPVGRDGITFVGSFRHPPNVDGVRWFAAEVLPLIRQSVPEVTLRIVGPDVPPEVAELAAIDGVEVVGWVPELRPVYAQTRVAVAPLRFGAGLKGKVGEALSYGVPMVVTPTATEGMSLQPGRDVIVAEEPGAFADGVVRLLQDDELWLSVSSQGRAAIEASYSPPAVAALVRAILSPDDASAESPEPALAPELTAEQRVAQLEMETTDLQRQARSAQEATRLLTGQLEQMRRESVAGAGASAVAIGGGSGAALALAYERDRLMALATSESAAARERQAQRSGRAYRWADRLTAFVRRLRGAAPGAVATDAGLPTPPPDSTADDDGHRLALAASGVLDPDWYRATYPDIVAAGIDPVVHYTTQGWREGRSPGPLLDAPWYRRAYPDVEQLGIDPAVHYVVWGWREGRRPSPWFDPEAYRLRHGLEDDSINPVTHAMAVRALQRSAAAAAGSRAPTPSSPSVIAAAPANVVVRQPSVPDSPAAPLRATPAPAASSHVDLVHLHAFKCSGTTFAWVLERNFPDQVAYVESETTGERLPWQRVRDEVDLTGMRAVTSHLMTLPPAGAGLARMHVAFVRDPVARIISAYLFQQRVFFADLERESLDEYLDRVAVEATHNYMTRHLSPQDDGGWQAREGWQLRPELIDLARPDLFVGITERFDESMLLLERRLAAMGVAFDGAFPAPLNTSEGAERVVARSSRLPDMVRVDQELYDRCNAELSRQLDDLLAVEPNALEDFRRRRRELAEQTTEVVIHGPERWWRVPSDPDWIP